MDCMEEKALKSSVRGEQGMKTTQQVHFDDVWGSNAPSEDFSVEYFLDFSHGDFGVGSCEEEEDDDDDDEEEKESSSVFSQEPAADEDNSSNFSSYSDSLLTNELFVPVDDVADLEWVSRFVDDSLSEPSLLCPPNEQRIESSRERTWLEPQPKPVLVKTPCFTLPVPAKARSKRTRPASRFWSVRSVLSAESSSTAGTSSSSLTSSSASNFILFSRVGNMQLSNSFSEPPVKKSKKKTPVQAGGSPEVNQVQRRCSHCHVQKTPQWRTGPLGPKTLCNACGVRYKSGRLFPEYRPACSPTFSCDIHSNSHRKVLEMRRKKELAGQEPGLNQMVQSF